jgi:hypothetical protein
VANYNPQPRGPDSKYWKGASVTYRTAHTRVSKLWGRASNYPCIACGGQAREWAYDGTDHGELTYLFKGKYPMKYSPYPEFYMPMCLLCHRRRDEYQDSCVNGHEMVESNIVRVSTRPGRRVCRQCKSDRDRRAQLKRKARAA